MRSFKKKCATVGLALALTGSAVIGVPLSASADTGSDGVVSPQGACVSGAALFAVLSSNTSYKDVGVTQHSVNGTNSGQTATFTSQTSGTVSISYTSTIEGGVNVALASIKASVSATASASVSVLVGNQVQFVVPAHKTGYAAYGAKTVVVQGKSYRQTSTCSEYNVSYPTVTAPTSVGWRTWIG